MVMVQKFRMPKYVNIWRSNEKGNKDELLMEAEMGGRRRVGGNLLARSLAPHWKQVDLGVILEGGCDKEGTIISAPSKVGLHRVQRGTVDTAR